MGSNSPHTPVLLEEVINGLDPQPGETAIDATAGFGGHAQALCGSIGTDGVLVLIDQDQDALTAAEEKLSDCSARIISVCENFRHLKSIVSGADVTPSRIVFDLGISSYQLTQSGRGFSFNKAEPLSMRMGTEEKEDVLTAERIVNEFTESELKTLIAELGEERYAGRIAQAIARTRAAERIATTDTLAEVIFQAVPASYRRGRIHPATRTFQALRMKVNDELNALTEGLTAGCEVLAPGGRIAVISFHSLEDRIVKRTFLEHAKRKGFSLITKKPIVPAAAEIHNNPRARSAKLRIIEKH